MNRRSFIISSLLFTGTVLNANKIRSITFETNEWKVIKDVYYIIFPSSVKYNLQQYNPTKYLFSVSRSKYFPRRDLEFILNGARWIQEDEIYIKNIDEILVTSWGERWLSYLLNYALEGLYSDPIYGGNTKSIGWNMINHKSGNPRPIKIYGKKL